jgi:pimeloyl-ACP methyl ester carboxylesterase
VHPVVFAHGLEGSPQGTKAVFLREELGAVSPWLGELSLAGQVEALAAAIGDRGPAVLVGSSLGGLAALGLAAARPESLVHLVLLAPAVGMARRAELRPEVEQRRPGLFDESREFSSLAVPAHLPATVVHGLDDDVIRLADVLDLVRRSPSARMILVHDDHPLHASRDLILALVRRAALDRDPLLAER